MNTRKNDIKFWTRVLGNLSKHKDKPYVPELIVNVEKIIDNLKKI